MKIYEDKEFLAFLDINPRKRGHAIVIPKHHAKTLLELPENLAGEYLEVVQAVSRHVVGALGATGFNFGSNNGESAGQAVPHVHIHILPRFAGEKYKSGFEVAFAPEEALRNDLDSTHKKIGHLAPVIRAEEPEAREEKKSEEKPKEKEGKKEIKWTFGATDNLPRSF